MHVLLGGFIACKSDLPCFVHRKPSFEMRKIVILTIFHFFTAFFTLFLLSILKSFLTVDLKWDQNRICLCMQNLQDKAKILYQNANQML